LQGHSVPPLRKDTALYSNTARTHNLGKIHDWVVLYYDRDGE
jgi:hypothetical protein